MWHKDVYEIYDKEDRVILFIGKPGLKKENVSITVEGDSLKIAMKGSRPVVEEGAEFRQGNWHSAEIDDAWYFHKLNRFDLDRIEAKVEDGILRLDLPYGESMKPRQIAVR